MTEQDNSLNYAAEINREMEILDYQSMMSQKKEEGREEGREEATIKMLKSLIRSQNITVEKALTDLGIPKDQWESLKAKLK
jgi:hypothetical protein